MTYKIFYLLQVLLSYFHLDFEKKINEYRALEYSVSQKQLNNLFNDEISSIVGVACEIGDQTDLGKMANVLYLLSYYTDNTVIADLYHKCFFKRDIPNLIEVNNAFGIAIKYRNMDVAKKIKQLYANEVLLPDVPEILDMQPMKHGTKVLSLNNGVDNSFFTKEFIHSEEKEIIVFFDTKCFFSNLLIKAIESDAFFNRMFSKKSTWIQVANQSLNYQSLSEWNKKYYQYKLYSEATPIDFKDLDLTSIPVIFIMENGKVIEELRGWPKSGRSEELSNLLKEHF